MPSASNRCNLSLKTTLAFAFLIGSNFVASALTNGLVLTPPMGYNSWYANGTNINEYYIQSIADLMVSTGMRDVGYQYLCIDDGWAGYRDTNGVIVADTNKFPSGMASLIAYVHSKGLKFGIYTVYGPTTCAGLPGSQGHVVQDANTYAAWGVDYVKYEGCSLPNPPDDGLAQCQLMGNALQKSGRPIVFTMSIGPFESWMPTNLNMWRGTGDFNPNWDVLLAHIDFVSQTASAAGPGAWNDPDVLGTGFLQYPESSSVFSMWCVLSAPLLAPIIGPLYTNILCNTEAIAVDQDPAGIQGTCVASNGNVQVWCKPLGASNGLVKAVALFNRGSTPGTVTANWSDLGLPPGGATVRNLWSHRYAGNFTNSYTATIPGHGVNFIRITSGATVPPRPVGTNYLSDLDWLPASTNPYGIGQDQSAGANPITIHGTQYPKGIGAHAPSQIQYALQGATRFHSDIGVDDEACCAAAAIIFQVYGDGTKLYDSGIMTSSSPTQTIDVNVTGYSVLTLVATNGVSGNVSDHADWAGARINMPPAPNIDTFKLTGPNLVFTGSLGSNAAGYYVFTSTNSALPFAQWTRIATNHFDASGNFAVTNPVTPGSRAQFFRIQMQ